MIALKVIAGATIGFFLGAAITSRDWGLAADRSFHAASAIAIYAWLSS